MKVEVIPRVQAINIIVSIFDKVVVGIRPPKPTVIIVQALKYMASNGLHPSKRPNKSPPLRRKHTKIEPHMAMG